MGRSNNSNNSGGKQQQRQGNGQKHQDPQVSKDDASGASTKDKVAVPLTSLLNALSGKQQNQHSSSAPHQQQQVSAQYSGAPQAAFSSQVPQWKCPQIHVWKKDSVTVINMRDDTDILAGLEERLRRIEAMQQSTASRTRPPAYNAGSKEQPVGVVPEPPRAGSATQAAGANNVQSFLNDQLQRMRDQQKGGVPQQPSRADPKSTAAASAAPSSRGASPQPAPVSLFSDPLWCGGSTWDPQPAAAQASSETMTSDVLSGLLGDLRSEMPTSPPSAKLTSPSLPPAQQTSDAAASSTARQATSAAAQSTAQQNPAPPAGLWTVAAAGQPPSPPQKPHAAVAATASVMPAEPIKMFMAAPAAGGAYMAPMPVQQILATGAYPTMATQPMFLPPGVQIIQAAPPGWSIAGSAQGKPVQAAAPYMINLAQPMQGAKPMPFSGAAISMEEYQRHMSQVYATPQVYLQAGGAPMTAVPIQQYMPTQAFAVQQHQQQHQQLQQQHQQQQQQQQQHQQQHQQHQQQQQQQQRSKDGAETVSPASRNPASANGVNVSAAPFVPRSN